MIKSVKSSVTFRKFEKRVKSVEECDGNVLHSVLHSQCNKRFELPQSRDSFEGKIQGTFRGFE